MPLGFYTLVGCRVLGYLSLPCIWKMRLTQACTMFIIYYSMNMIGYQRALICWWRKKQLNQLTIKDYKKLPNQSTTIVWIIQKFIVKFQEHKNRNECTLRIFSAHCGLHWGRTFAVCKVLFFLV